jgi:small subunit ribosomal protein S20
MANTSAAKKALRASIAKEIVNKSRKSRVRSFVRKVEDAIKAGNEKDARIAFKDLEPEIMKAVGKKVFKLNTAARKLSRLSAAIKKVASK